MPEGPVEHRVKNPRRIRMLAAMSILCVIERRNAAESWREAPGDVGTAVHTSLLLTVLALMGWTLYRVLKKPTLLRFAGDTIRVNGKTLVPGDIRAIHTMGVIRPIVGIKPRGKRVVPIPLSFRFIGDRDLGMADLRAWAERYGVEMVERMFWRWI